ncbi:hypothetical protein B0G76_6794 [Paraburkholderia sp. BL23I1N1]|uniref:hypothetical protein n=1 Tax=Paraburkholderia sp. BL23I1N1 TaxID=1938802 RepID=UPI000E74215B|nr:hypothetical protein [Paraburkholderia sp. BL23I1N1]RKE25267.1 hypothetical protein B0G76_6794 [Paraburkholderia sp. BL23I1N1]
MKKLIVFALSAVALLAVSGCGSKKDANKSNFADAIQDYLNTTKGVCVALPRKEAPFALEKKGGFFFAHEPEKAAALVNAGLLSAGETEVPSVFPNQKIPATQYTLTDEGKKYLVKGGSGNFGGFDAFCGGKYKVKEVVNFTEPADMFGTKISQVNYSLIVEDAPSWVTQPAIQAAYPDVKAGLGEPVPSKAVLVATSEGWMHERLFKSKGG